VDLAAESATSSSLLEIGCSTAATAVVDTAGGEVSTRDVEPTTVSATSSSLLEIGCSTAATAAVDTAGGDVKPCVTNQFTMSL